MKHKDPLRPLFDALREESEPISSDRRARALARFRLARLSQRVEGQQKSPYLPESQPDEAANKAPLKHGVDKPKNT